jgi:uncharacterized membrane protein YdjX (TVP38/TMEM64 family)
VNAARWRLVALVAVLVTAVVLFTTTDLVDAAHLRDRIGATGAWAPLVYVPVSAVLGALLVPGPLLAGISGVLFGPVTGTVATIASAVLSALIARSGGRRAGRPGVEDLLGERAAPLAVLSRRYGTAAVLGQRLAPGVPDAPLSWAFGALGLSVRQVMVGTAVGAFPRAFSYSAIGASLDDPTSPWGIAGIVVLVLSAAVGAEIGRRMLGAARRSRRSGAHREKPPARETRCADHRGS